MSRASRFAIVLVIVLAIGLVLTRTPTGHRLLVGLGFATACGGSDNC